MALSEWNDHLKFLKVGQAHNLQISSDRKPEGYEPGRASDFIRFFPTWQLFLSEESEDHEEFLSIRTTLSSSTLKSSGGSGASGLVSVDST